MHRTEGAHNSNGLYVEGPPNTTITASALNSMQEEIANVIENSGITLNTAANDTRGQLWEAIQLLVGFDTIVETAAGFNDLFERTGANAYKIKDDYKTVKIRNIGTDYSFTGVLSGGDTWGAITTNNCVKLECEPGTVINVGDTQSYLEVNTTDCVLTNVYLKGTGGVAAAISQSFKLNASYVIFNNCRSTNRKSNVAFSVFQGSATAAHNLTSNYRECVVTNIVGSEDVNGFKDCINILGCYIDTIEATGTDPADIITGFKSCTQISNSTISNILHSGTKKAYACYLCTQLTNINVDTLTGVNGASAFHTCDYLSSCFGTTISGASVANAFESCNYLSSCGTEIVTTTSSGNAIGFSGCEMLGSCFAKNITAIASARGFVSCSMISSSQVTDLNGGSTAEGFVTCNCITGCEAEIIDSTGANSAYGFNTCNNISGCYATDIDTVSTGIAYGYSACSQVSACIAQNIDSINGVAHGFSNCDQISGCKAVSVTSSGSDAYGFDSCDKVSGCLADTIAASTAGVGFLTCLYISSAQAVTITGATNFGFLSCQYIAASFTNEAVNDTNDWVDTNDAQVANQFSTPAVWT
jgi:hypothetical protein